MLTMRVYENEFKEEAVKLAIEIGTNEADKRLGVSKGNCLVGEVQKKITKTKYFQVAENGK
jgi:hypothetical protein